MKLFKKFVAVVFVFNIFLTNTNFAFAQYDPYGYDYGNDIDYSYGYGTSGGYNDCYDCGGSGSYDPYGYDYSNDIDYSYGYGTSGGYNDCYGCNTSTGYDPYGYDYGNDIDYSYGYGTSGGYNDCYGCMGGTYYDDSGTYYDSGAYYGTGGTYYGSTGGTYYGNTGGTYYGTTPIYQTPVTCTAGYHLVNNTCIQDTKYCNGAQIPITQTCTTIVVCNYPYVNQNGVCVYQTQTCPNGAVIPVNQTCPAQTQTCPNGVVIPIGQSCPSQTQQCPDGTIVLIGQACPTQTRVCPNGQVLPVTQTCPTQTQTCADGSVIPVNQICPQQYKTCLSGIVIPISQTCGKYCNNGVFINETSSCTRVCPNGNTYPENVACPVIANHPTVNLIVTKNLVNRGESVTLSWVSTNASSCSASNAWSGSKVVNGSEVRYNLQSNSTFSITCYNVRGESANDSVFVNVREIANVNLSRVVTTVPTRIGQTTATCNGVGIIANNLPTTGWFEYGTTSALGKTTNVGNIGSSVTTPFSNTISDLKPNTKYYCRAVIANSQGTFKGELMSFTTTGTSVKYIPPVTTTKTTTTVKKTILVCYDASGNKDDTLADRKAIEVSIEKYSGSLSEGGVVEYRVRYQNTSRITVSNTNLRVMLPKELQFLTSTRGNFNSSANELNVSLGDVRSNEGGEIFLRAKVADNSEKGKTIVTEAYMSYEMLDANRGTLRDEVKAYTISTLGDQSMSAGDTYDNENNSQNMTDKGGVSYLPNTVLEWLAVIALIMILIFLGKRINDEFKGKKVEANGHH